MKNTISLTLPVFILSLLISLLNANFLNLGFADAAEFALTAKLFSIAHAPGFPAYVLLAGIFLKITSLFNLSVIASLVAFSAICNAKAASFLSLAVNKLTKHFYPELSSRQHFIIALASGLTLASGATVWHWSHSVEVYSLHLFAFCLALYGLAEFKTKATRWSLAFIGIGIGIGFANHHLTMILFLPFLWFLLWKDWNPREKSIKGKKSVAFANGISKSTMIQLIYWAGGVTVFFYSWMFIRASSPAMFAFGQPDTLDRLIYHLSGGAWIKNTQKQVSGLPAMRFPYFMHLTWQQLGFLLPFCIAAIFLLKKNLKPIVFTSFGYYIVLLAYQLRIDQTADTDAYMITAFAGLTLTGALGIASLSVRFPQSTPIFLLIPLIHFGLFYKTTDLQKFDLSTSILEQLDEAAPLNSVVLIADWTSVINYMYARIDQNFRPDLVVLNYDLKFTHRDIFPRNYPQAYEFVKAEYDRFIALLEAAHPQEIYNTGLTLDSPELQRAFHDVINKLKEFSAQNRGAFMADPKAFVFLSQSGHFPSSSMSGALVSNQTTGRTTQLSDLSRQTWLTVPHIRMDAAAADKLVDLEAALDFTKNEFQQRNDAKGFASADSAYQEVKKIQRELKRNMPFLFRPPGK